MHANLALERPQRSRAACAAGLVLVIIGVALPSRIILGALGVVAAAEARQLWLGAIVFRLALGVLGAYLVLIGRLPIWDAGSGSAAPPAPRPRWAGAALGSILVVALGLRLHRLGVGLWYDEIAAYVRYMGMSLGEILTTYDSENQHFLFTLSARAALTLLGDGPASFRLPAALFGVASVAALYQLARRVASEQEALLSAGLLTVSYHHVWFSQNGRGYSGLLFWTLLSSWLFIRALDERRSRLWLGYAAAVALGVFAHVTMLLVALAHAAVFVGWLVRSRTARGTAAWRAVLLGFGLSGLFTLQLYALVVPQLLSTIGAKATVREWASPLWQLLELTRGLKAGFAGSGIAVVALAVFLAGLVSFWRSAPSIVVFLVLPAALGATTLAAMGHAVWPRFFFFLMGFGVLIAVRGTRIAGRWVAQALRLPPAATEPAGTAVALVLIVASATMLPVAWLPKQDYLGARGFLEAQREPGDAVVTVGLATFPYSTLYRTGWESAASVDALNAIRARARRTWVVYTLPLQLQSEQPALMAAIRQDFMLVRRFGGTLNGGTIYLCRAEGAPASGVGRRS